MKRDDNDRVSREGTDVNLEGWVVAGAILAFSQAFAPIHELGHIMFGAEWVNWARVTWPNDSISGAGILAGYGFELLVFFLLDIFVARKLRFYETGTRLRGFCAGYMAIITITAPFSDDFILHVKHVEATRMDLSVAWLIYAPALTIPRWVDFLGYYRQDAKT